jgi:hypothetical protein
MQGKKQRLDHIVLQLDILRFFDISPVDGFSEKLIE